MSGPRRLAGFTPVHLLVLVAVAELSITRLAVGGLRPRAGQPIPRWFELLDNVGLFLLYFGATLAIAALAMRAIDAARDRDGDGAERLGRAVLATVLGGLAAVGAVAVVTRPGHELSLGLHTVWALALVAVVAAGFLRRRDRGAAIGAALLALPLAIHAVAAITGGVAMTEDDLLDGALIDRSRAWGLHALVIAALATPYCFAPRPIARSVTRLAPLAVAMLLGGLGAVLVRRDYATALDVARLITGVDLGPGVPSGDMSLYLLALATLTWSLTACTLAASDARREIGMGVALVVLGGYGFDWPFHFLISVVGLVVIVDAAARVRDEEAVRALRPRTPPIDDDAWQGWIQRLAGALRGGGDGEPAGDREIRTVTVRGDDDSTISVVVGERAGVPFKLRLGRMAGALVSIDLVCGREVAETTRATVTLHARPDGPEPHPPPPPCAPAIAVDDPSFAARFRARGDAAALAALLDEPLRARAAAVLDGWTAWWAGAGLRVRIYPGIGAPLDHPVPISDLAMRGAGSADRMVAVVDVLAAAAARGLQPGRAGEPEPAVLD